MSGIFGIIDYAAPVPASVPEAMGAAASHRGSFSTTPTKIGDAVLGRHGGGFLDAASRENEVTDLLIGADMRLDNAAELVEQLRAAGTDVPAAADDAAILSAGYRLWGRGLPERLIGDFALAVWDARRRVILLARDPMGMRPLYYRVEPKRMIFASEIKQVVAAPGVPRRIFEPAIAAHVARLDGAAEWTPFEGIAQLPPGCAVVFDGERSEVFRYFSFDPANRLAYGDERDYVEHFLEIFQRAVYDRLRPPGTRGLLLSGGWDSGSLASVAGKLLTGRVIGSTGSFRCYSYASRAFPESDEREVSDLITQHFAFPSTAVEIDGAYPLCEYPGGGPDFDGPYLGYHDAMLRKVFAIARSEGIDHIWTGQHGDVVVGGVVDHLLRRGFVRRLRSERRYRSTYSLIRNGLLAPLAYRLLPGGRRLFRRFRSGPGRGESWLHPHLRPLLQKVRRAGVDEFGFEMKDLAREERLRLIRAPWRITTWAERTCAAAGMTLADPWSDIRLAAFALAVPQSTLNAAGDAKRITRLAMEGIMPEEARRVVTSGHFVGPRFEHALKGPARPAVEDLLTRSRMQEAGYVDVTALRERYEAYRRGEVGDTSFWAALTLEMWLRGHWS